MTIAGHPDLTTPDIAPFLGALRRRWLQLALFEALLWGVLGGLVSMLALSFIATGVDPVLPAIASGALVAGTLAIVFWLRRPDAQAIAVLADRRFVFQQKLSSVLELYRHGPLDGPVARALLDGASAAVARSDRKDFEPIFSPRRLWLLAAIALAALVLAARLLFATPSLAPSDIAGLEAADVSSIAQALRADAVAKDDEELAAIADSLDNLAAQAQTLPREAFEEQVYALFERAEPSFGRNPAHARTGFEGASPDAYGNPQTSAAFSADDNASGGASGGAMSDQPMVEDLPNDAIRTTSLPGMGTEGVSLGLTPPDNAANGGALDGDGDGHELQVEMPQSQGAAEGAGSGQSNMAGSGELDAQPVFGAPPVAAGFEDTRELSAAQMGEGSTTRVALEIEEAASAVTDIALQRDWPVADTVPVTRSTIPSGATRAVERYFIRNLEAQP